MNTYHCFHAKHSSKFEVEATTTYEAQCKAYSNWSGNVFRKRIKQSDITVLLVGKEGEPVQHNPAHVVG